MLTSTRETGSSEFEPDGSRRRLQKGKISSLRGIAVDGTSGEVFAANGSSVVEFESSVPVYPIDNPAIVDAVTQAATHTYGDFQVSKDAPRGVRVGGAADRLLGNRRSSGGVPMTPSRDPILCVLQSHECASYGFTPP